MLVHIHYLILDLNILTLLGVLSPDRTIFQIIKAEYQKGSLFCYEPINFDNLANTANFLSTF